jgi:hypothetical protein
MAAMEFSHALSYDAPTGEVAAMLADRGFREQVCEATGSTRWEVSIDGGRVVVDQARPTRGVPPFARTLVGDEIRIVRRETWADESSADLTVEVPGKPATFSGAITLGADGDRSVESVTGRITVRIPLVGGRLEGLVADVLRQAFEAEQRVGRAWLAARSS